MTLSRSFSGLTSTQASLRPRPRLRAARWPVHPVDCGGRRYWCWIAAATSTANSHGAGLRACEVYERTTGTLECGPHVSAEHDHPGAIAESLGAVERYGVAGGPRTVEGVHAELRAKRPPVLELLDGPLRHFVVATKAELFEQEEYDQVLVVDSSILHSPTALFPMKQAETWVDTHTTT